jgi:general stress protein YciG
MAAKPKSKRGFAAMEPNKQLEAARKGGRASHRGAALGSNSKT